MQEVLTACLQIRETKLSSSLGLRLLSRLLQNNHANKSNCKHSNCCKQ